METSNSSDFVPLKAAAFDLNITTEGLRKRLIRIGQGQRKGSRWFIPRDLLDAMRGAQPVLMGCRK
jgi:hypothetical protein